MVNVFALFTRVWIDTLTALTRRTTIGRAHDDTYIHEAELEKSKALFSEIFGVRLISFVALEIERIWLDCTVPQSAELLYSSGLELGYTSFMG